LKRMVMGNESPAWEAGGIGPEGSGLGVGGWADRWVGIQHDTRAGAALCEHGNGTHAESLQVGGKGSTHQPTHQPTRPPKHARTCTNPKSGVNSKYPSSSGRGTTVTFMAVLPPLRT
jgi:hypothetical protein